MVGLGITKEEMLKKAKEIEDFIGPYVRYSSDKWPEDPVLRWLMEYAFILKKEYYKRKAKSARKN